MVGLINIDIGGNSARGPFYGSGTLGNPSASTYSNRRSTNSRESRACKSFVNSLDSISGFSAESFGRQLSESGFEINMRAFDIFGALLDNWAKHVDIGTYDPVMQPREYQMAIQAKRIIDALKVYNS